MTLGSWPSGLGPGAFLPTTDVFDVETIYSLDINSQEFKEFIVRLRQSVNNIAMAVNIKDTGYYPLEEFVCGQVYFPNPALNSTTEQTPTWRQVFRKVYTVGPLPNATTKYIPTGIAVDSNLTFTRIYGCATSTSAPRRAIPLPYMNPSALNNAVALEIDNDYEPVPLTVVPSIKIVTAQNLSYFDKVYVVLEYIKQ